MSAELVAKLIEAGTPAGLVAEVAMELGRAQAEREMLERKKEQDRERQRRRRSRDVTGHSVKTRDERDPPKENISNPRHPTVSDETVAPAQPKTDELVEAVAEWNRTAERFDLPKVRGKLAGSRRQRLRARIAEHGIDGVKQAIAAVGRSPFCRGETSDFRADIGFLSRPDNFAKLLEGGFEPKPDRTAQARSTGPPRLFDHLREQDRREAAGAHR